MEIRKPYLSGLVLLIFVCEISARRNRTVHNDDSNSDSHSDSKELREIKRFLFRKDTTSRKPSSDSVLDNLVRTSTLSPTFWTQRTTNEFWRKTTVSSVCNPNPCQNDGTCSPAGYHSFVCKCVGPWRGIYCNIPDACYYPKCKNGGTCRNAYDDYWCDCPADYYGKSCESKYTSPSNNANNCKPNICNTGQCVSLTTTYYCRCPKDRYGLNCEKTFSKRGSTNEKSFYELLSKIKRVTTDDASSEGMDAYDEK